MATTKADIILEASASNAAAATKTGTGVDLQTGYGAIVTGKITNGATGPTIGCDFVIQISFDNSAWKEFARMTASVGNNDVNEWAVDIPVAVQFVRSVFTGNTAQAVTVEALGSQITAV